MSHSSSNGGRAHDWWWTVVAIALSMSLGFVLLMSTGQDDAYLSFWPAYTLVHHGEMTNYNGERVEQSSSLLHVLALALAMRATGLSSPTAGYWIGVLAGVLAMIRAVPLCRRMGERPSLTLLLLIGTCPAFLYWCFGGLETPLVAWLLVEISLLGSGILSGRLAPFSLTAVLATSAYLMVRPEGAIVLASTLLVMLATGLWISPSVRARAMPASNIGRWLLLVFLLFAALCAFRLFYFGSLVPQPLMAKVGGDPLDRMVAGADYLTRLIRRPWAPALTLVLLALPFLLWRELRSKVPDALNLFLLLLVGANTAFIVMAGGDWMRVLRFAAHFAPIGILVGYRALRSFPIQPRLATTVVGVLIASQLAGLLALTFVNTGRPIWSFREIDSKIQRHSGTADYSWVERANRIRTRDILFLANVTGIVERLLEEQDRLVVMSGQAGMVIYYLAQRFPGRIEFADRFGLSTTHLSRVRNELGLRPTPQGLDLSMTRFMEAGKERQDPAWSPDLVFDIDDTGREIEPFGYRVVYEQKGVLPGPHLTLGSRSFRIDMSIHQYLALRKDLASKLGLPQRPRRLNWTASLTAEVEGRR